MVALREDEASRRGGQRLYSVRDLVNALNISRTALVYYEEHGIVSPMRDEETGYRWYTARDVFRLMGFIMLKNVGIRPRDLGERLDSSPFSSQGFDEYRSLVARRIAYCQAQLECLEALQALVDDRGAVEERYIEPYYLSYDSAERGFKDVPDDTSLISLIKNMPIGSLGFEASAEPGEAVRWGRTVRVRFAPFIDGLQTDGLQTVGGCKCVCAVTYAPDIFAPPSHEGVERIGAYLDAHGMRPAGPAFGPYALPGEDGVHALVCVPVA